MAIWYDTNSVCTIGMILNCALHKATCNVHASTILQLMPIHTGTILQLMPTHTFIHSCTC